MGQDRLAGRHVAELQQRLVRLQQAVLDRACACSAAPTGGVFFFQA